MGFLALYTLLLFACSLWIYQAAALTFDKYPGTPNLPVNDTVDVSSINFDNVQLPSDPGIVVKTSVLSLNPVHGSSFSSFNRFPGLGSSAATSRHRLRNVDATLDIEAHLGWINSSTGQTLMSSSVNVEWLAPFYEAASLYGTSQFMAGANGTNGHGDYFRFTNGSLTMVATSYGAASTGSEPFNWGDFATIASWLGNLTAKYSTRNQTWVGVVYNSTNQPYVDFAVLPAIADQVATDSNPINVTVALKYAASAPQAQSTPTPATSSGGDKLRRNLEKRMSTYPVANTGYKIIVRSALTQMATQVLYDLTNVANSMIMEDSPPDSGATYQYFRARMPYLQDIYPNAAFEVAAELGVRFNRDFMFQLTGMVRKMAIAWDWSSLSDDKAYTIFGEILDSHGNLAGFWNLGNVLLHTMDRVIQNPDGTHAYGQFVRDEL